MLRTGQTLEQLFLLILSRMALQQHSLAIRALHASNVHESSRKETAPSLPSATMIMSLQRTNNKSKSRDSLRLRLSLREKKQGGEIAIAIALLLTLQFLLSQQLTCVLCRGPSAPFIVWEYFSFNLLVFLTIKFFGGTGSRFKPWTDSVEVIRLCG